MNSIHVISHYFVKARETESVFIGDFQSRVLIRLLGVLKNGWQAYVTSSRLTLRLRWRLTHVRFSDDAWYNAVEQVSRILRCLFFIFRLIYASKIWFLTCLFALTVYVTRVIILKNKRNRKWLIHSAQILLECKCKA